MTAVVSLCLKDPLERLRTSHPRLLNKPRRGLSPVGQRLDDEKVVEMQSDAQIDEEAKKKWSGSVGCAVNHQPQTAKLMRLKESDRNGNVRNEVVSGSGLPVVCIGADDRSQDRFVDGLYELFAAPGRQRVATAAAAYRSENCLSPSARTATAKR